MGKMELHGTVIAGDFEGCNVYRWDENSFHIVRGEAKVGVFAAPWDTVKEINKSTVEKYEEISSAQLSANAGSVGAATFWFGMAGGLLASQLGKSTSHDIAIYFKDGKESLLRLSYDIVLQDIKKILFNFSANQNNSASETPITNNVQGANTNNINVANEIKKYKELLDMGAITQEEYDAKKKQLLGL